MSDDQPDGGPEAPDERRPAASEGSLHAHIRQARTDFESQVAHARDQFEEANDRITARAGRNLILAILIGLAFGAVVLGTLLFIKWLFVPFAVAVAVFGTFELTRALQAAGRKIDLIPQLVLGAALVVIAFFADHDLTWTFVFVDLSVIVLWRLIAQMAARDGRTYGAVINDVLTGAFVQVYVPCSTAFALLLLRQDNGEWWVLTFISIAVAADTGAYASGLSFGKHPMAPLISPKKTWEGFAGAVVAATIAGVLFAWLALGIPPYWGVLIGLVILATATIGDLGESMLKRDLGIKDMSSWLPGHGGVLDRLDSILPSAPAALGLYILLAPLAGS